MENPAPDIESIFSGALEIESPEERERYLIEACAGRNELLAELRKLLAAAPDAEKFLDTPAIQDLAGGELPDQEAGEGLFVGRYKLLEQIGSGGMGTVFMAEQTAPMRRMVAVKMISPGMDSGEVLARFDVERQALALMDHPNIASVFDAGTSAAGRPYFVMELIRGLPITEYCDEAKLSIEDRLGLFSQVCRAVQHAHQKGIIHRDLKPTNVLVTLIDGVAVAKVIDFGIAKAVGQKLTDATLFTGFRQLLGTTMYMSPEQAALSGDDIDTRSDIYSLGVLLYELITGTTPFDEETVRKAAFDEVRRMIREDDPPKPSTRLSSLGGPLTDVSSNRSLDPRRMARLVRGDLDRIVMKTLRKNRNRRYESASELARDVDRYLKDEPVEAGPESPWYHLVKFAKRHRAGLAVSLAVVGSILSVAIVSLVMAAKAARSEADAKAVLLFFRDKILAAARPADWEGGLGREVSLLAALDSAEASVAGQFADRPIVEAGIRDSLGMNYYYLGVPAKAIPQLERTHALRSAIQGENHPDTLMTLNNLASAVQQAGKPQEAAKLARRAYEAREATLGPDHADTLTSLNNLASDLYRANETDEAIRLLERTAALRKKHLGLEDPATLATMCSLGLAYSETGRLDEALPLLKQTYDLQKVKPGPDHPETLITLNNLAAVHWKIDKAAEALPLFEQVLSVQRAKLGSDHPQTLITLGNVSSANWKLGRREPAIKLLEEAYDQQVRKFGPTVPMSIGMAYNLALCYRVTGQPAKAVPYYEIALQSYRQSPGSEHEDSLTTMNQLASAYLDARQFDPAVPLLRECLATRIKVGPDSWERFHTMSQLGAALAGQKDEAGAEKLLIDGYEGLKQRAAGIPPALRKTFTDAGGRMAPFYEAWGKPDKAAEWKKRLEAAGENAVAKP